MGSVHYRVEWTEEAERDALHIVGHFASRISAEQIATKFERQATSLATYPMCGRIVQELERIGVVKYREV